MTTDDILAQLKFIRTKKQEYFVCISLDSGNRLIARRVVSIGTLTSTLVHPREIFAGPLKVTNSQDYLHVDLSKTTHGVDELAEIGFVDAASTKILPEFLMTEPLEEVAAACGPTRVISRL